MHYLLTVAIALIVTTFGFPGDAQANGPPDGGAVTADADVQNHVAELQGVEVPAVINVIALAATSAAAAISSATQMDSATHGESGVTMNDRTISGSLAERAVASVGFGSINRFTQSTLALSATTSSAAGITKGGESNWAYA